MTRCLDEARLQSYFDGELPIESMESVTSHLASCETCATAARELEEESALVMNALAMEFEASVPTERLRQRIDEVVLGDRLAVARSANKTSVLAGFFSGLFNFGSQRTLGYAGLVVVLAFAAIVAVVKIKTTPVPALPPQEIAANVNPPASNNPDGFKSATPVVNGPENTVSSKIPAPVKHASNGNFRTVKYPSNTTPKTAPVKLLPGERSYLQTIARLDSTIKSNKKSMRPGLQVEYERNLAVVDRAIAATRSAAKSNPSDPDAADFMFAAYQSKVDLLNTIADARVGGGRGH
jgi:anti-sigma factor RsiW